LNRFFVCFAGNLDIGFVRHLNTPDGKKKRLTGKVDLIE
jgi:hypothetical protein